MAPKKSNSVQQVSKENRSFLHMSEGWHSEVRGRYVNDEGAWGPVSPVGRNLTNLSPRPETPFAQTLNDRNRGRAAGENSRIQGAGDGGGFSYNAFSRGFRITDDQHRKK